MKKSIDKVNLAEYTEQSDKGLIFEVDLDYPQKLHDIHSDHPLAAEKKSLFLKICYQITVKK